MYQARAKKGFGRLRPYIHRNSSFAQDQGYFLVLVVTTAVILGAGIMALSTRTFTSLLGSIRQGQSRQAQQAAETGINKILATLNTQYPYLLINQCDVGKDYDSSTDCAGWKTGTSANNLQLTTSVCQGTDPNPPSDLTTLIAGDIKDGNITKAKYQLISYRFNGDTQQGGEALIRVKGEAFAAGLNRSTAVIEQSIPLLPKNCNVPINTPSDESSFPGLLATESINMGNNDVTGSFNANIYCFPNTLEGTCIPSPSKANADYRSDIGANNANAQITGNIYAAAIALPSPPSFPGEDSTYKPSAISGSMDIIAGQNTGNCFFESTTGITHCLVSSINLTGDQQIRVWTKPGTGPASFKVPSTATNGVHLYFPFKDSEMKAPVKQVVSMTGGSSIVQAGYSYIGTDTPNAANLALFGLPQPMATTTEVIPPPTQTITIGGGSTLTGFIFFPDAIFGINGSTDCSGSGKSAKCTADGKTIDEVSGAVWTRIYDGSSGNKVNINVPDNMGRLLYRKFGIEFAPGIREFVALGVNRWQLYQIPNN